MHSSCSWLALGFIYVYSSNAQYTDKVQMELAWLITLSNSFLRRGNKKAANWAISYSKQQQYNRQIWEYSIQIIILPQSLSDRQYLGDTGYHKLSFRHWHLEVSKHRSAWETDVLSFLKTIGRCGSPALFFWLRYSELILFPWLSLCDIKVFQAFVSAHLLISRQLIAELAIL